MDEHDHEQKQNQNDARRERFSFRVKQWCSKIEFSLLLLPCFPPRYITIYETLAFQFPLHSRSCSAIAAGPKFLIQLSHWKN